MYTISAQIKYDPKQFIQARSITITKKNEKCSTSIYLVQRLDYCFFCQLQRKLGLFQKVFMLVALVNHSLCWRLVYTSGAPLITSLVSWGTQPQHTRVHNFKHFPSQAFWISKVRHSDFLCLAFVSAVPTSTISSISQSHVNLSNKNF